MSLSRRAFLSKLPALGALAAGVAMLRTKQPASDIQLVRRGTVPDGWQRGWGDNGTIPDEPMRLPGPRMTDDPVLGPGYNSYRVKLADGAWQRWEELDAETRAEILAKQDRGELSRLSPATPADIDPVQDFGSQTLTVRQGSIPGEPQPLARLTITDVSTSGPIHRIGLPANPSGVAVRPTHRMEPTTFLEPSVERWKAVRVQEYAAQLQRLAGAGNVIHTTDGAAHVFTFVNNDVSGPAGRDG
jgi:hypothetical protein